jgi:hypothetical protein
MITINAHWEIRNLGVSCNEYVIDINDDELTLLELEIQHAKYEVVKLPVQKSDFILPLQKQGFMFVEQLYECTHNLREPDLSNPVSKLILSIDHEKIFGESIDLIKQEILSGMFNSDRVAIDSKFGLKLSANRYIGWIDDLTMAGSEIFILKYRNNPVGFFVLKKVEDLCYAILGGIFSKYKNAGFGIALNYLELKVAKNFGCSALRGVISSNNPSIYRINDILGYKIIPKYYVFTRHGN